MLHLILGRAKTGKTQQLLTEVKNSTASEMSSRIMIVPEQLSHQTERRLSELCGDGISYTAEVLSFTRLENRVSSLYGGSAITSLDDAGRILAAHLAMKNLAGQLEVYARAAAKPDFLSEIVSMIDELKTSHVTGKELMEASVKAEEENHSIARKTSELAMILSAYTASIAQGEADPRDKLEALQKKLETYSYACGRDFFVDGFSDFTAQEFRILEVLLRRCSNMTIALLCDSLQSRDPLFAVSRATAARLLSAAQRMGLEVKITSAEYLRPKAELSGWIDQNLFSAVPQPYPEAASSLVLEESRTLLEECRKCAAFLRQQAMNGVRYRNMFVAAGNSQKLQRLLSAACEELHIPIYASRKQPLSAFPCISFLLLALEAAAEGLRTETVLAYLKTGYTGITADEADLLENYAIIWSIRGEKWKQVWQQHPEGYDHEFTEADILRLKQLNRLREKALKPLFRLRKALLASDRVSEMAIALYDFINASHLYEQISTQVRTYSQTGQHTEAQELAQVWTYLIQALQQVVHMLGAAAEKPAEFYQVIRLTLQQYQVGTIPAVLDRVSFGSLADVRGQEPEVLCILGANDGAIPSAASNTGLLSDHERTFLRETCEVSLGPGMEEQLSRQLLQIYSAVTAPVGTLYVSWHTTEAGSSVQPSFLVTSLKKIFPEWISQEMPEAGYTLSQAAQTSLVAAQDPSQLQISAAMQLLRQESPALEHQISEAREKITPRLLTVSPDSARLLFGNPVQLSASRLDSIRSCPLQFFLNYGLKAKKIEPASFDALAFGTFLHKMLEENVPLLTAQDESPDMTGLGNALRTSMAGYKKALIGNHDLTERDDHLFDRNYQETFLILQDIAKELSASDFRPRAFELKFGDSELPPLPVLGQKGRGLLSGTVDRADLWSSGAENYLRIIDYKSGSKKFDYTEIYHGFGLQMLIYLFELQAHGIPGITDKTTPAGVLYYPASVGFASSAAPAEAAPAPEGRSGLVLGEEKVLDAMEHGGTSHYLPEARGKKAAAYTVTSQQLQLLDEFVNRKLSESVDRILSGDFQAEPFYRGKNAANPCDYCSYTGVCQKDSDFAAGFYCRKLSAEEFWKRIGDETDA